MIEGLGHAGLYPSWDAKTVNVQIVAKITTSLVSGESLCSAPHACNLNGECFVGTSDLVLPDSPVERQKDKSSD